MSFWRRRRSRRKETYVETHQILTIRKNENDARGSCAECPMQQAIMVTPEEAASIAGVNPRTVYRWVEDGMVHFTETREGSLLVCLNSLSVSMNVQVEIS
jgi:hypothetical protein